MTDLNNAAAALGRLLLSVIFLWSGFQKLAGFGGTVGYMASLGLPVALTPLIILGWIATALMGAAAAMMFVPG